MKFKILFSLMVLLIVQVNAVTVVFQDNTHSHILRCCNDTNCTDLKDIEYISNNTERRFDVANIQNLESCYEVGNKLDVNISNLVLSFPETVFMVILAFVLAIVCLFLVFKSIRGKK